MIGKGFSQTGCGKKNSGPVLLWFLALICSYLPVQAQFSGWSNYQVISVTPGAAVTTAEVNYPLLVRLSSGNAVWAACNSTGSDIQFSDSTGTVSYSYQRLYWNYSTTTGAAEFWVLVPGVMANPATTRLRMYYGNAGATDKSNGAAVFSSASSNYAAVWHMTSMPGSNEPDATGATPDQNAVVTGSPANIAGPGGPMSVAKSFSSGNYYIVDNSGSGTNLDFNPGGPYTLSCWVNPTSTSQQDPALLGKTYITSGNVYDGTYSLMYRYGASDLQFHEIYGSATASTDRIYVAEPAAGWHHIVAVRNGTGSPGNTSNMALYVDGALQTSTYAAFGTAPTYDRTVSFCIGKDGGTASQGTHVLAGSIYEAQVSNTTRNAGWVALSYEIQGAGWATYLAFGAVQTNAIAWPNPPVLATPVNNALNQPSTVNFSWVAVTGTATYELQVSGPGDNTFATTTYDNAALTGTSQTVSGLSYATTYYWRVQGLNGGNSPASTGWSSVNSFTTAIAPPSAAPLLSSPASASSNLQPIGLTLYWGTVSGATSYGIQVSTGSSFSNTVFNSAGTVTGDSVVPLNLTYGTTYYWEVNATNPGGTTAWSGVWTFSTIIAAPGAPGNPLPANGAINQSFSSVTLNWSQGTGGAPSTYNLNFGTSTNFSSTVAAGAWTTSYSPGALAGGTTYYWQVQAANANSASAPWSAIWSFTTVENYNNWLGHQQISLNTTASGAGVTSNLYNFPVLIRLNSANFSGFSQTLPNGADIRFSKLDYSKALPFQIEYWSPNDTAVIWVKLDTVLGNASTQSIVMHYNRSGAVGQSNGKTVFDTANGFQGVFHLSGPTGAMDSDATVNQYHATPVGSPHDTTGIFGPAKWFDHNTMWDTLIGTASGKLNFQLNTNYTISAWVCPDSFPYPGTTDSSYLTIASKGNYQYYFALGDSTIGSTRNGRAEMMEFRNGTSSTWTSQHPVLMPAAHQWYYVAGRVATSGTADTITVYTNGATAGTPAVASTTAATQTLTASLCIGKQACGSGTYGSASPYRKFWGRMQEVRMSNVARSADWIKLCYENQGATDYLTALASGLAAPQLSEPANGATGLPTTLTLGWNISSGAVSYGVQVSSSSTFGTGTIVFSASGLTAAGSPVTVVPSNLANYTVYYWEANASNGSLTSAWSGIWSFTTMESLAIPLQSAWFMYSLNLHPTDSSTTGVFGGLQGFVLAMDGSNNLYWPSATLDEIGTSPYRIGILDSRYHCSRHPQAPRESGEHRFDAIIPAVFKLESCLLPAASEHADCDGACRNRLTAHPCHGRCEQFLLACRLAQ